MRCLFVRVTSPLATSCFSWKIAGAESAQNPVVALVTTHGLGIAYWPFDNFVLTIASATGLMLEPSGAIATPPNTPVFPPYNVPSAWRDRSPTEIGRASCRERV